MKKMSIKLLSIISVFLLAGCPSWKKKASKPEENQPIIMTENQSCNMDGVSCNFSNTTDSTEINFDNQDNNQYQVISGKSIFADDKIVNDPISVEETNGIQNQQNAPEEIDLLVDQKIDQTPKEIIIERDKVHLGTILFDFDKYEYPRGDYDHMVRSIMSNVQSILFSNPAAKIIVEGHACNSCGSERYNLELSNNRALTIKDRLMKQTCINPENISVFGCGTSHLIVHGQRDEQAPNRRVEVFVIN